MLIPPMSFDYKLIWIYIPLYYFLASSNNVSADKYYVMAFATLLVPKAYFYHHLANIGGPINCAILIWLTLDIVMRDASPD